jgi:hypothetical protein
LLRELARAMREQREVEEGATIGRGALNSAPAKKAFAKASIPS